MHSGATLYGTTQQGGSGNGVVFGLSLPVPQVRVPPTTQTAENGSSVALRVLADDDPSLTYQWFFNGTNALGDPTTNCILQLGSIQPEQAGLYTVVVRNLFGELTSVSASLNVIPCVERRWGPGILLQGDATKPLNLEYAQSLEPKPNWLPLVMVPLVSNSAFYFDLSSPLPAQRFFRTWQAGAPTPVPALNVRLLPALTLTGGIGSSVRVDCINQFGPIDAWTTLATVTLTNASQLYFDTSAVGQPARLYRLVPVP